MALFGWYTPAATTNGVMAVVLMAALQVLGAGACGKRRSPEADVLAGWSVAALLFLVCGTLSAVSFRFAGVLLVAMVAGAAWRCRSAGIDVFAWRTGRLLIVALPIIVAASTFMPTGWDDQAHWLLNAQYLLDHQHLPHAGGVPSPSDHAEYPYGWPLIIYWVASLTRLLGSADWSVGTGPVFNVLLLTVAARLLLAIVARGRVWRQGTLETWHAAALGLLAVSLFSPGFVPRLLLESFADHASAVTLLGVALLVQRRLIEGALTGGARLQLALLLLLCAMLKEDNPVPALALMAAAALWDWRATGRWRGTLGEFGVLCAPMVVAWYGWHVYAARNIPGGFVVRPPWHWQLGLGMDIARGYATVAWFKAGYFLPMLALAGFAAYRWWTRRTDDRVAAFAFLAGAAFLAYNLFLICAYFAIFSPYEAHVVASLWRYNTHIGLLEAASLALLAVRLDWAAYVQPKVAPAMLCLGVVAFGAERPLERFDETPFVRASRAMGHDLAALVPAPRTLGLVDLHNEGAACVTIRFSFGGYRVAGCMVRSLNGRRLLPPEVRQADFIWANGLPVQAVRATGLVLSDGSAHLAERQADGAWRDVRDWPLLPGNK